MTIDPHIQAAEGRYYIDDGDGLVWFDRLDDAQDHRIDMIREQAAAEERAKIVAHLKHYFKNDHVEIDTPRQMYVVVLHALGQIEAGKHLK